MFLGPAGVQVQDSCVLSSFIAVYGMGCGFTCIVVVVLLPEFWFSTKIKVVNFASVLLVN